MAIVIDTTMEIKMIMETVRKMTNKIHQITGFSRFLVVKRKAEYSAKASKIKMSAV